MKFFSQEDSGKKDSRIRLKRNHGKVIELTFSVVPFFLTNMMLPVIGVRPMFSLIVFV